MNEELNRAIVNWEDRNHQSEPPHPIPSMTDPLSKHWDQPGRDEILVDGDSAIMSQKAFDQLHDYSASYPTGVYVGKMWKRHDLEGWLLCWYGESEIPGFVSNNYREILIV